MSRFQRSNTSTTTVLIACVEPVCCESEFVFKFLLLNRVVRPPLGEKFLLLCRLLPAANCSSAATGTATLAAALAAAIAPAILARCRLLDRGARWCKALE